MKGLIIIAAAIMLAASCFMALECSGHSILELASAEPWEYSEEYTHYGTERFNTANNINVSVNWTKAIEDL